MSRIDLHLWGSSSFFETSISSLPSFFSLLVNVDQLILRPCNRYVLQVFFLLKFPVFLCPRTRDRRTPSEEENSIPFTALRFMNQIGRASCRKECRSMWPPHNTEREQ